MSSDEPDRQIFKIDVGNHTKEKAEEIIRRYREMFGKKSFSDIVRDLKDKS